MDKPCIAWHPSTHDARIPCDPCTDEPSTANHPSPAGFGNPPLHAYSHASPVCHAWPCV